MKFVENAKTRMAAFFRERKERSTIRRLTQGVREFHARDWLIRLTVFGVITAMIVEWGWALLFTINTTGHIVFNTDWASSFNGEHRWEWVSAFEARWPVLIGRAASMIVVVIWSMIWLPMWFLARGGGRWARVSMAVVGIWANALVASQGTFVLNETRQDQVRRDLNIEQTAAQGVAGLVARRDQIQGRLDALINPDNNSFQAQAARAGPIGWAVYVETSRRQLAAGQTTAERFARIESAQGSAAAAQEYQRQIDDLTAQIAEAPTQASVAAHVEDRAGAGMDTAGQLVEVYWPLAAAFGTTAFGILAAWWLTVVWGLHHSVERSGWASEAERIEDLRAEEPVVPQDMKPPREVVTDAETGEEMVKVKPHWRKLKKGKPQRVDVTPEPEPDETGVPPELDGRDSALRAASEKVELPLSVNGTEAVGDRVEEQGRVVGGAEPKQDSGQEGARQSDQQEQREPDQPELSEQTYSSDDLDALLAPEPPVDAPDAEPESDASAGDDGEGEHSTAPTAPQETATDEPIEEAAMVNADPEQPEDREPSGQVKHHDPREEPETDPARLIAAVAAE